MEWWDTFRFRTAPVNLEPKNWTHGDPWAPMGTHGDPWEPHGDPMGTPWGPHGTPWDPMGTHGDPRSAQTRPARRPDQRAGPTSAQARPARRPDQRADKFAMRVYMNPSID